MSITHEEFRRVLRIAFPEIRLSDDDGNTEFRVEDGRVHIILSSQTTRSIGNLQLPVTKVTLEFGDMAEEEKKRFVERFSRSFQRGGG